MTDTAKHTPGPWLTAQDEETENAISIFQGGIDADKNRILADVFTAHIPLEEAEANARLIAAAPELLEALKHLRAIIERGRGLKHAEVYFTKADIQIADTAIAKSEGME